MQNELDYKNIRKIGLVCRFDSDLDEQILILKSLLEPRNIELLLFKDYQKDLGLKLCELDELFKSCDFVIALGGDGTLISLCRKACEYEKAILGINAGNLGFLTDCKIDKAEAFFASFFKGNFKIEKPYLLEIVLEQNNGKVLKKFAFNDVILRRANSSMTHIKVYEEGQVFNEYKGDGLIICTPAGSTAYNLSANGPIIYTLAEVFVLTPICSHSFTQRPIVLPRGFELEVVASDCTLYIDGQESFELKEYKSLKIGLSQKSVKLIYTKDRDYFQILKEKLHWGN